MHGGQDEGTDGVSFSGGPVKETRRGHTVPTLFGHKERQNSAFATVWIELEKSTLNKVNQIEEARNHVTPLTRGV